jgi:uncharacterized protein (DUF111 family)
MTLQKIGYGAGSKDPKEGRPNFLRLALGKRRGRPAETILVMETTVDDMTAEVAGHTQERLLAAGALDVFIAPVQMKKNRPGMNLTVLAEHGRRPEIGEILFAETTTLGVRIHEVERQVLERKVVKVKTRFGTIAVKLGLSGDEVLNVAPEFEDCRRIAAAKRVSLKQVQHAAIAAYQEGRRV